MADEKKNVKGPNMMRVTLRLIILLAACFGLYTMIHKAGIENLVTWQMIVGAALALTAAVIVVQLVVWALGWVKQERVSELGLHIVRFAVILTVVALSVFVMLSIDYTNQYKSTLRNELCQQAMVERFSVQELLGEDVQADTAQLSAIKVGMSDILDKTRSNDNRHICLYLWIDNAGDGSEGWAFVPVNGSKEIIAASSDDTIPPAGGDQVVAMRILDSITEARNIETMTYLEYTDDTALCCSTFVPVCTTSGKPVGVLELCERQSSAMSVFSFASLSLFLTIAALICLFSFAFYGVMQLLDTALRPAKFDKSRKILSCGREAARPILFFVALTAAVPVMMLLFSQDLRAYYAIGGLPEQLDNILPLIIYFIGFGAGLAVSRKRGSRLTEMPSDLALGVAVLCNVGMMLMLDTEKLAMFRGNASVSTMAISVLIVVCGISYGVSYRTITKYQQRSDALFGYDKYAYLCSSLGAISGIIFGALLLDMKGPMAVRITAIALSTVTCVISIILLEDIEDEPEADQINKNPLKSTFGGVLMISAVGLALCYNWVYLSSYLFSIYSVKSECGYKITPVAFCVTAPVIAFCFANRLRLKSRFSRRAALIIAAVLAAGSFLPMVFIPSELIAVASCGVVCLSVMFLSAGVYSCANRMERTKLLGVVRPLLLVGLIAAALAVGSKIDRIALLVTAGVVLFAAVVFLFTRFPTRQKISASASESAAAIVKNMDEPALEGKKGKDKTEALEASNTESELKPEALPEPESYFAAGSEYVPESENASESEHSEHIPDTDYAPESVYAPAAEPVYDDYDAPTSESLGSSWGENGGNTDQ